MKKSICLFGAFLTIAILIIACKPKVDNTEQPEAIQKAEMSEEQGPLISVSPDEFLALPEDYQAIYVAGYIDATTSMTYSYSLPEHNNLVKCFRSRTIGEFTMEIVKWLKKNPDSVESVATAIVMTTGILCDY